jgi:hypothetical protein
MSKKHIRGQYIDICTFRFSVVLERMLSEWVVAARHSPRNLAHAHPPTFVVGIIS